MKKALRTIFICGILLVLLAGFARTVLAPKPVNTYENRYAEKVQPFTAQGFADGEFQDSLELALADQVQCSELLKRTYNNLQSSFMRAFLPLLTASRSVSPSECNPGNYDYVALGNEEAALFGPEHICIRPRIFDDSAKADVDRHSANTNAIIARHPEIDFYAFYVEKDADVDFTTGQKQLADVYIFNSLDIKPVHSVKFVTDTAPGFDYYFFSTDHHWNLRGSYLAYTQLHTLMRMQGQLLEPVDDSEGLGENIKAAEGTSKYTEFEIGKFSGSRATGAYSQFSENFYAYRFDFPKYALITQNGVVRDNYGNQEPYLSGECQDKLSYRNFYGYDAGEVVISKAGDGISSGDTGKTPSGNNILIIGDSYDNALLKLIAAHYDNLYAIDLRYYKAYFNADFDFDSYVSERGIKTVLIAGSREVFSADEFLIDRRAN